MTVRRTTVKEVKKWIKSLEENRYKKTYASDARRVSWLVNNNLSEDYDTMPVSMKKKWSKAQYGRERFLAKEFIKHLKSKQMNEQKLRKTIKSIIKETLLKEGKLTEAKDLDKYSKVNWKVVNNVLLKFLKTAAKDLDRAIRKKDVEHTKDIVAFITRGLSNAVESIPIFSEGKLTEAKYKTISLKTEKGYKEAERLQRQGWKVAEVGLFTINMIKEGLGEGKLNEKEMKISDLWKEYVKKYGKDKAAEKLIKFSVFSIKLAL